MSFRPTSELVAIYWLRGLAALNPDTIATLLPGPDPTTNNLTWAASGFIQVAAVGGTPMENVPVRQPVISVDVWAANVSKKRAPWGRANALAEAIVSAVWDLPENSLLYQRPVALPTGYRSARVMNVSATEPQRRPSDQANYAHFGFEMPMTWVSLP